ncbi:MAG TPA: hypothetical protein VF210_08935 [Pseudomonadales bacterium]
MNRRSAIAAACLGLIASAGAVAAEPGPVCAPGYAAAECGSTERCEAVLEQDPYDVPARIALCDALVEQGSLLDAMVVLRQGLDGCAGRSYACSVLQIALSNVEELAEKDAPDLRADRRRDQAFKRQYCLGPSASDESIQACNEALLSFGEDGALYQALGAKYQRRGQPAQALQNLRRAVALLPDSDEARRLLDEAEAARLELADACLASQDLDACNAATLAGEPDELRLQRRRAELLQHQGRRDAALQALLTAQSLAPDDSDLARGLLPLVDDALETRPDDPELAAARAAALAAVGEVDPAILAYRRTLALNPADEEASRRLLALREQRRERLERLCFATQDIDVCRQSILPGEPDEQRILAHVAAVEAAEQRRAEAEQALTEAAEAAEPSSPPEAGAEPALAAAGSTARPLRFRNAPAADGSTH